MVKLIELDAAFVGNYNHETQSYEEHGNNITNAQGVMFQCPICAQGKEKGEGHYKGAHYVVCWFNGMVPNEAEPGPGRWDFSGTSIDSLTLNPSVHLSGPGCGWHGWVKSGDAA